MLEDTWAHLRATRSKTLGAVPLVVIAAGRIEPAVPFVKISDEEKQRASQKLMQMQAGIAALSPNGKLIVAKESSHQVQLEQPDLVVEVIRQVVAAQRKRMSTWVLQVSVLV